jgi:hypothetical protein
MPNFKTYHKAWTSIQITLTNKIIFILFILILQVEERRLTPYSTKHPDHEVELIRLWKLLKPRELLLSRRTEQWQEIGFQGDDPAVSIHIFNLLCYLLCLDGFPRNGHAWT